MSWLALLTAYVAGLLTLPVAYWFYTWFNPYLGR
jgi:hypothetical protein